MGDQLLTKAELECITANFIMTINALTAQVATLSTQVKNNTNNNINNTTNNNNINNQNRGGGPVRVPRGGNDQITMGLSSEVEEIVTEEGDERGNRHDYNVKAGILLFYGTMGVEEFLEYRH